MLNFIKFFQDEPWKLITYNCFVEKRDETPQTQIPSVQMHIKSKLETIEEMEQLDRVSQGNISMKLCICK